MKKTLCLLGIIGLITPFGVKALTGDVTVTCDKSKLSKGDTTTCTVSANITEEVSSFSAKVDLGDNLSLVSFTADSSWQGNGDGGNIDLYTDTNKSGNFNIGTMVVSAGNESGVSTSVGLSEVKLSDASFVQSDKVVTPFDIRIPSVVNTLNDIRIGGNSITDFSSDITDYEIVVESNVTSVSIEAVSGDTSESITGDIGSKNVSYGENNFSINVKSELGIDNVYNLKIKRPEIRELKSLKINGEDIDLQRGIYEYTFKVENSVTSVSILATHDQSDQPDVTFDFPIDFVESFGSRTIENLEVGSNEVLIKIADENDDELVYKINISRLDENGNVVSYDVETMNVPNTGLSVLNLFAIGGLFIFAGYNFIKIYKNKMNV